MFYWFIYECIIGILPTRFTVKVRILVLEFLLYAIFFPFLSFRFMQVQSYLFLINSTLYLYFSDVLPFLGIFILLLFANFVLQSTRLCILHSHIVPIPTKFVMELLLLFIYTNQCSGHLNLYTYLVYYLLSCSIATYLISIIIDKVFILQEVYKNRLFF